MFGFILLDGCWCYVTGVAVLFCLSYGAVGGSLCLYLWFVCCLLFVLVDVSYYF